MTNKQPIADADMELVMRELRALKGVEERGPPSWVAYASLAIAAATFVGGAFGLTASYGALTQRVDTVEAEVMLIKGERYATKSEVSEVARVLSLHRETDGHATILERTRSMERRLERLERKSRK